MLLHQSLCSLQPFPFFLCFSMGTSKFFIESKYFEFNLESGGSFFMLRVVERDKGYYQLLILGRNDAFWLLLTIDDGSRLENNLGYLRKSREPERALRGQRCSNFLGRYLAIKEFNGGGRGGFIVILEGKNSWGWGGLGGFVETFQKLLSSYLHEMCPSRRCHSLIGALSCRCELFLCSGGRRTRYSDHFKWNRFQSDHCHDFLDSSFP